MTGRVWHPCAVLALRRRNHRWLGRLVPLEQVFIAAWMLTAPVDAWAQPSPDDIHHAVLGFRARFGGRYDNVRLCVASPTGTKGGPAGDISFFVELGLARDLALDLDLPVFRPLLFAASFDMLQFEPTASLRFRSASTSGIDVIAGPTLGVSLHHGPDYNSESSGDGRTPSFFALGPIVGGYVGLDFKRPGKLLNLQLGITPYFIPLFSIGDPEKHRGAVVGGLLDGSFRFSE
ncbi:hypothetical protein ACFL5O_05250 [Myxococcota bacterium]